MGPSGSPALRFLDLHKAHMSTGTTKPLLTISSFQGFLTVFAFMIVYHTVYYSVYYGVFVIL